MIPPLPKNLHTHHTHIQKKRKEKKWGRKRGYKMLTSQWKSMKCIQLWMDKFKKIHLKAMVSSHVCDNVWVWKAGGGKHLIFTKVWYAFKFSKQQSLNQHSWVNFHSSTVSCIYKNPKPHFCEMSHFNHFML